MHALFISKINLFIQFGTTLIIIITGLVVSVILAYVYKKQAVSDVKTGVDNLFNNYGMNNSEAVTDQVDFIQQKVCNVAC